MHRFLLVVSTTLLFTATAAPALTIDGTVRSSDGRGLSGVFVTARDEGRGVSVTVVSGREGTYRIDDLAAAMYAVSAHQSGYEDAVADRGVDGDASGLDFVIRAVPSSPQMLPASTILGLLPEGEEKRRFIIDCMGCHSLNDRILYKDGVLIDEAASKASVDKMLSFAGAATPFPVMAPDRASVPTAAFMATHVTAERMAEAAAQREIVRAPLGYTVTEYDLPEQRDFPHDLMRDRRGHVLVTGMFSGAMYILDPATGRFETKAIPTNMANPRALDVDADGNWWILCGMPMKIARYTVERDAWGFFDIGMYPHSIKVDSRGRVWFNGHFTNNPIRMGYVDVSGEVVTMEVPPGSSPPEEGGPIPYGLRVGPDGTVWSTELAGNRLVRYSPDSGEMKTYDMPSPHSGPRRLDVAPDGVVWIPEFAAGKLARFDPATETFTEFDFPTPDSLPYCARVNPTTGIVWISQCGNDAIARFDPARELFVEYRLPTRVAFIRHLDVDPETGDVWGSYSHSPGLHPGVVRLQVR